MLQPTPAPFTFGEFIIRGMEAARDRRYRNRQLDLQEKSTDASVALSEAQRADLASRDELVDVTVHEADESGTIVPLVRQVARRDVGQVIQAQTPFAQVFAQTLDDVDLTIGSGETAQTFRVDPSVAIPVVARQAEQRAEWDRQDERDPMMTLPEALGLKYGIGDTPLPFSVAAPLRNHEDNVQLTREGHAVQREGQNLSFRVGMAGVGATYAGIAENARQHNEEMAHQMKIFERFPFGMTPQGMQAQQQQEFTDTASFNAGWEIQPWSKRPDVDVRNAGDPAVAPGTYGQAIFGKSFYDTAERRETRARGLAEVSQYYQEPLGRIQGLIRAESSRKGRELQPHEVNALLTQTGLGAESLNRQLRLYQDIQTDAKLSEEFRVQLREAVRLRTLQTTGVDLDAELQRAQGGE